MQNISIKNTEITKVQANIASSQNDLLAVEEPLEIRLLHYVNAVPKTTNISVTMRTPGNDAELAIGFLFTENIIKSYENIKQVTPNFQFRENVVLVELQNNIEIDLKNTERNFYTSSSCGVCGKSSIDAVMHHFDATKKGNEISIHSSVLTTLPNTLRNNQNVFEQTGGLHASALFNTDGKMLLVREDVGRHNALDKIIGCTLISNNTDFENAILLLSGRISFELVQKAAMSSIKIIAAVGAPSSLAVKLAAQLNITLVGFLRGNNYNIYTFPNRIIY